MNNMIMMILLFHNCWYDENSNWYAVQYLQNEEDSMHLYLMNKSYWWNIN